jgi:hypothetical protein
LTVSGKRSPALAWFELALKTQETLWTSAFVIAHRTQRMAAATSPPCARDAAELARMWPEKVSAATVAARRVAAKATSADVLMGANVLAASLNAWSAAAALTASRTPVQYFARQARFANALKAACRTTSTAASRSVQLASVALDPYHTATRRNAKRLAKPGANRPR